MIRDLALKRSGQPSFSTEGSRETSMSQCQNLSLKKSILVCCAMGRTRRDFGDPEHQSHRNRPLPTQRVCEEPRPVHQPPSTTHVLKRADNKEFSNHCKEGKLVSHHTKLNMQTKFFYCSKSSFTLQIGNKEA